MTFVWAQTSAASAFRLQFVRARILAGWAWARLDREIAAGLSIEGCEARLLRAEQLLYPEVRRGVAAVLRNILDAAEASGVNGRSARPHDPAAIIASHDRLVELIELLRSDAPMTAPAVARTELLACDRNSPLVSGHDTQAIAQALDEIAAAKAA